MVLKIDIDELKSLIIARYLIEEHHKKIVDSMIHNYQIVEYDTLASKADLLDDDEKKKAFGLFSVKQLALDPYEQIENSEEVKQVFSEFYPKLKELSINLL